MDTEVSGFGVRITDREDQARPGKAAQITFTLIARFPPSKSPADRALGEYPTMQLAEARTKARHWRQLIAKGIDPKVQEERERQAELRRQRHTFEAVAEEFIAKHVGKLRTGDDIARDLRREF